MSCGLIFYISGSGEQCEFTEEFKTYCHYQPHWDFKRGALHSFYRTNLQSFRLYYNNAAVIPCPMEITHCQCQCIFIYKTCRKT